MGVHSSQTSLLVSVLSDTFLESHFRAVTRMAESNICSLLEAGLATSNQVNGCFTFTLIYPVQSTPITSIHVTFLPSFYFTSIHYTPPHSVRSTPISSRHLPSFVLLHFHLNILTPTQLLPALLISTPPPSLPSVCSALSSTSLYSKYMASYYNQKQSQLSCSNFLTILSYPWMQQVEFHKCIAKLHITL